MEVDMVGWAEPQQRGSHDGDKFVHMKEFVAATREFHATHNETSVSLMSRHLGLIVSTGDLTIFSPGRSEVCAFLSALWRVLSDERAPQWACVAVLARAVKEPSARYALTHTYKFLPVLAQMLNDSMSHERKMRLLFLMQDISYGIKITWQEAYLPPLLKQLTDWVSSEASSATLGHAALSVLVNLCYGNVPAVFALQRTVDTKHFVTRLINMKDEGYGGVEVCRLLLCLTSRGSTAQRHVHSYLSCATTTLNKALAERDPNQLHQTYLFLKDLCSDPALKSQVTAYPHFSTPIADAITECVKMCNEAAADSSKPETACLEHVLNCLTILTDLELFSLRGLHGSLLDLSVKGSRLCLTASLQLLCTVLSQYKDERRIPLELFHLLSDSLPSLLVPPTLEPGKAGLPWLELVGVLSEFPKLQERLLHNVTASVYEEALYSALQHMHQNGCLASEEAQQAALVGCRTLLTLAPQSREWDAALAHILAHHQVCKLLSLCLSGTGAKRIELLQLVKHPHFPPDKIHQVFSGHEAPTAPALEPPAGAESGAGGEEWSGGGAEAALVDVDSLIQRLTAALDKQKVTDISMSSVMELYTYKMSCLEHRLHSQTIALKGASDHTSSLQHSLALLHATSAAQQDVLYTTQIQNERHKESIARLNCQLEDAEKSLHTFRAKVTAERLDKENQLTALRNSQRAHATMMEGELKNKEKELSERDKQIEKLQKEIKSINGKLQQQSTKNNELASVLVKFEERVKVRDRKLEEAAASEVSLRKELDHKEQALKVLEKTVLERENRLYQVTAQLEEMKRVQDMVAKLMGNSKSGGS